MYFHNSNAVKRATSLVSVSQGMPKELQPRFPLMVPNVTARRAKSMIQEQSIKDQLDPATQPVWFQRHSGLYTPYWSTDEYQARFKKDPSKQLTHPRQIFVPYWMNDKRGNVVQRPHLGNHTASRVLFTIGDDTDGLGKGFNPLKAIKRAAHFTPKSFRPKNIFGAIGSVTGTVLTGGLGPIIAPKVFSANSSTMRKLGMATTAIAVVAGGVVLAPAIAGSLGPSLSSAAGMVGKAVTGMGTFFSSFNALSPGARQQQASQLTAQQIADIESGQARLTEQGVRYDTGQAPGSLRVQDQMVPEGYGSIPASYPPTQAQTAGGIDPTYLLIGGAALVGMVMLQKRG